MCVYGSDGEIGILFVLMQMMDDFFVVMFVYGEGEINVFVDFFVGLVFDIE